MKRIHSYLQVMNKDSHVTIIGPSAATVAKINNRFRFILYLKSNHNNILYYLKDNLEKEIEEKEWNKNCSIQIDRNPMSSY